MKRRHLIPIVLGSVFLSLCVSACNVDAFAEIIPTIDESEVTELGLSEVDVSLRTGEELNIEALVTSLKKDVDVTWRTSDKSVVTVEGFKSNNKYYGKLNGRGIGEATVLAIAGTKSAYCTVTVGGGSSVKVTSVTLSSTSLSLVKGETARLTATVLPVNATNQTVVWTSSDSSVVSVDNGEITANKEGSANIIATCGGKSASCSVVVRSETVDPDTLEVYLDKTELTLEEGKTAQLKATPSIQPDSILWQSSDKSVATVSDSGFITAKAPGSATISVLVTKGEQEDTATCSVTVTKKADASEYESLFPARNMNKGLHLYIHYKRDNSDYNDWAIWIWQKVPVDSEGSLWGATRMDLLEGKITPMSTNWMLNSDANISENPSQPYCDEYGQVMDIDLSRTDIVDGVNAQPSPLIPEFGSAKYATSRIGFLIVDQTKMSGDHHWVSDGGIEAYIMKVGQKLPTEQSYLHIYCTEGSVANFQYSSGEEVAPNPTANDHTGIYSSKNDISDLKRDLYSNGVSTSETFLKDEPGVGYQIFVPSFADGDGDGNGDLRGIINKLDYLEALGVKCLWLTPIQESGSYHGYDVTDYYKIDSKFGTIEDYQELIFKAHQKGMKVLMDMVINHTSKSNVLFGKSQRAETGWINGREINYRDMYLWKYKDDMVRTWDGHEGAKSSDPIKYITKRVEEVANAETYATGKDEDGNLIDKDGNVFAENWYRDGSSDYYYYGKFGSGMAELNYSCQATRDYMTDMCKYWLSFGLDGFRLDAVKHIYLATELDIADAAKYSSDVVYDASYRDYWDNQKLKYCHDKNDYSQIRDLNVAFWKEFAGKIKSAYPNCFLVGENFDGWNQRIAPFYKSMDSQFDFSTYYHLNEMLADSIGNDIKTTLDINNGVRGNHINGAFTSNHDVARMLNHAASSELTVHSVEVVDETYTDETGTHYANADYANNKAKYYSALTLLTPGLSWIYYGDELGMSGNTTDKVEDSIDDHGNNIDRWYRQPMRWGRTQGQDMVTKYRFSGLDVTWDKHNRKIMTASEQQLNENSLLRHFQELGRVKGLADYPTYGNVLWGGSISGDANTCSFEIKDDQGRDVRVYINNTGVTQYFELQQGHKVLGGTPGCTGESVPAYGFLVLKML